MKNSLGVSKFYEKNWAGKKGKFYEKNGMGKKGQSMKKSIKASKLLYNFYDWFGRPCEEYLEKNKLHSNHRCPRDGVRLISYVGDPHKVVHCPNCGYFPSYCVEYDKLKDIKEIEEKIRRYEEELNKLRATLSVVSCDSHIVRRRNLKT